MVPYRADIDGLRALSVIAVILYHAGLPLFGGGFIGVDVFFVISGFLITSLILHEQEAGAFSLIGFYHRRIRRILPALLAMMSACAIAGWFLMAPEDYRKLGKSIAGAALSFSNVQFWRDAGYFDTPAAEKPLLHTWSLGVEEQFYLLFPLYLILVARYLPRWRRSFSAGLCAISFAIGAIGVYFYPVAAFYLTHARLWELLVGALLAMKFLPVPATPAARTAGALLGLAAIFSAVLLYSGDTTFPGVAALPPTLGAALVIWSGIGGTSVVGKALASRPLVFVGKISYSLYLWHFPLLAFGFYIGFGALTAAQIAGLLALAFLLSVLSWRFVEQPARQAGAHLTWRKLAWSAAVGVLVLTLAGVTLDFARGFPARMGDSTALLDRPLRNRDRQACFTSSAADVDPATLCRIGDPTVQPSFILWGDSHAETFRGALAAAAASTGRAGLFAGESACAPLIGVDRPEKPACREVNEATFEMIARTPSIKIVVLAARWAWWSEGVTYKGEGGRPVTLALTETSRTRSAAPVLRTGNHVALAAGLEHTIAALLAADKQVWIVGPVPEVGYDVPRYFYLRALGFGRDLEIAPTLAEFDARQLFVLDLLNDLARRYPVGTIWPHERLCNDVGCDVVRDGRLIYSDDDHLSVFGAQSIAGLFAPVFE